MEMTKLLLVAFAIHLSLMICGVATIPGASMYNFLTNPVSWESTDFLGIFSDLFLSIGVAATIIAGTVVTRSDIFLFAGIAGIFLSFGMALAELWSIVSAQSNGTLATILVSPIILIYLLGCVAWWRGRA